MKTGPEINTILKNNLSAGSSGTARSFSASTTTPPSGATTYELSAADSEGQCLAWLEGTDIKYYAKYYTDASPVRKIPLNADSSQMFSFCSVLTNIDVSGFDTGSVTDMSSMFSGCSSLTDITGLSGFDTGSVTYMYYMFRNCSGLTSLGVSGFDTSRVTNMGGMFSYCSGLTSLEVSNIIT
ncbi:MAG: BspA family leucine-rich repeat surface protein, partial [Ruminococcus sp.]|nr:BspA family leucine-rich repeat surface protein [Ruminococcus sp.]